MAYPQSIPLHPQFLILNASFSILLPQISLIQPHFSIFNSAPSILSQKNGIFTSKSPQNTVISDKMSASAACTACSFFQVCQKCPKSVVVTPKILLTKIPRDLFSKSYCLSLNLLGTSCPGAERISLSALWDQLEQGNQSRIFDLSMSQVIGTPFFLFCVNTSNTSFIVFLKASDLQFKCYYFVYLPDPNGNSFL